LQLTTDLISRPTPRSHLRQLFGNSANGSMGQIMKARGSISVPFDLDIGPAVVEVDLFASKYMSFEVALISDFCER